MFLDDEPHVHVSQIAHSHGFGSSLAYACVPKIATRKQTQAAIGTSMIDLVAHFFDGPGLH
jgi:hypothetical protein